MRKESGLEITDIIAVKLSKNAMSDDAVTEFSTYISNQVLADSVTLCDNLEGESIELDGFVLSVSIDKV